jgi:hypothetical protein
MLDRMAAIACTSTQTWTSYRQGLPCRRGLDCRALVKRTVRHFLQICIVGSMHTTAPRQGTEKKKKEGAQAEETSADQRHVRCFFHNSIQLN